MTESDLAMRQRERECLFYDARPLKIVHCGTLFIFNGGSNFTPLGVELKEEKQQKKNNNNFVVEANVVIEINAAWIYQKKNMK